MTVDPQKLVNDLSYDYLMNYNTFVAINFENTEIY